MTSEEQKILKRDPEGLLTYEYIANHIDNCDADLDFLVENIILVDRKGQFCASAARYLHAIDAQKYAAAISRLVAVTIDKDREHRYLPDVMLGIYGDDYQEHVEELSSSDDNFRRIYKRLYPNPESL